MTVILNPDGIEITNQKTESVNSTKIKHFAIIGTRQPDDAQKEIAYRLAWCITHIGGHWVRTGAAYGIDQKAMEGSLGKNLEVYLPWKSYNGELIPPTARIFVYDPRIHTSWTSSVTTLHPHSTHLSRGAFKLHARNFGIVSGCSGVIALPDENGGGGTGQGIRIAKSLKIPLIQGNRGSIQDTPRWIGKALQQLNLVSKDLKTTILGEHR